ncbi:MAG: prefoldin subunit alpha [Candidatus Woesearchaeota archaeon]|nr:prefoldin subunit alpha [Candidatus Woesearchaeota archaeon]
MEKNEKQKELKEKYMEFQLMNEQFKKLQEQLQMIMQQGIELNNTIGNLDDFKKIGKENDLFVPITGGVFAKAKLLDSEDVLVNVGAGVVIKKPIDDVKTLLSDQLGQMNAVQQEMLANLQMAGERVQQLDDELQDLVKESKE